MKTMREVVRELQSRGHRVEYYVRKDGGILIKRIDNQTYKAASGNIQARSMLGIELSAKKSAQLKEITKTLKEIRQTEADIKDEWRRVRDKWRAAFPRRKGKAHPAGTFTWKRIKYSLKHYGREEALRRIAEAERYASGIAYSKNVEQLAMFIRQAGEARNSSSLMDLADTLIANAYAIKEEWIKAAYDELYKLNAGAEIEQVVSSVKKILRLL